MGQSRGAPLLGGGARIPNGEGRAASLLLAAAGEDGGSAALLGAHSQGPCCHPVLLGRNIFNPKFCGEKMRIS